MKNLHPVAVSNMDKGHLHLTSFLVCVVRANAQVLLSFL